MASRFFTEFAFTQKFKKTRTLIENLSFKNIVTVIYLVMFVVMTVAVWWHAGGDRRYRTVFAVVLGIFWPVPAAILIFLWIQAMLNAIADWIDRFNEGHKL